MINHMAAIQERCDDMAIRIVECEKIEEASVPEVGHIMDHACALAKERDALREYALALEWMVRAEAGANRDPNANAVVIGLRIKHGVADLLAHT